MTDNTEQKCATADLAATLNNLYELGGERGGHYIEKARSERRWQFAKRTALTGLTLFGMGMWIAPYAPMRGWSSDPTQSSLGVIPIHGEIGGTGGASAEVLVPAIERACKSSFTKAVVLRINSPGGSPTDAERIAGALDYCRPADAPAKPVIAEIEGLGASAAYLVAIHADEVYATRYALVGSIGAVMRSVDAGQAIGKFGLRERVFASGALKAGNSPWSSNTRAQDELNQSLVDGIARLFIAEVKARRASKLKPADDVFSGRMWVGTDALRLGLVDGNQTFENLRDTHFSGLPVHEFRPPQTLQDRFGLSAAAREFGIGLSHGIAQTRWE